jgi:hypothetical protein
MKIQRLISIPIAVSASTFLLSQPAMTQAQSYYCGERNNVPTTFARVSSGEDIPLIEWKDQRFSGSGWTPRRRCVAVSERLQRAYERDTLRYLTVGEWDDYYPVICTAFSEGGTCLDMILTLNQEEKNEANEILLQLLRLGNRASSALLTRNSNIYVHWGDYLACREGTRVGDEAWCFKDSPTESDSSDAVK